MRILSAGLASEEGPNVEAVDRFRGQRRAGEAGERGEQINRHRVVIRFRAGGDAAGPTHYARHARAALPRGAFALAERAGAARVIAVAEPRTVVGGEDHERVALEAVAGERADDFADGPIDFHDDVTVEARGRFALELVAYGERHMGHRVGEVEEKRPRVVAFDKRDGVFGILRCEVAHFVRRDLGVDDLAVFVERQPRIGSRFGLRVKRPHVIGVGETE